MTDRQQTGDEAGSLLPTERWWLIYTPIWGLIVGAIMLGGAAGRWGDLELIPLGVALALGAIVPPIWAGHAKAIDRSFSVVGFALLMNYFLTPYFFEVLGMHYGFRTKLAIQGNPLFLYFMTIPYFATYSALTTVGRRQAQRLRPALRLPATIAIPFVLAALETALNANPLMSDLFWFDDLRFMLTFGTLSYGAALACAAPVWISIDESVSLRETAIRTLAASMAMVIAFELLRGIVLASAR